MPGSATGSSYGEVVNLGRYRLHLVAKNDRYSTYDGFVIEHPEYKVRVKGYVQPTDETERSHLSLGIKNGMALTEVARRLRSRLEEAKAAQGVTDIRLLDFSKAGITQAEVFLLDCFRHLRLLTDRMRSTTNVYVIKDYQYTSLQNLLSNGRLDTEGAFFYFYRLLKAVYFLHKCGFVHRDISTAHLYISSNSADVRLGGTFNIWKELDLDLDSIGAGPSANGTDSNSNNNNSNNASRGRRRSPTPQPGGYGICSHCGRDVQIITDTGGGPGDMGPPLNSITTPCRHCGTMQNRLRLLQTIVGTPAFLPPEALSYELQSAMSTGTFSGGGAASSSHPLGSDDAAPYNTTEAQARDMWSCGVVLYFMLTCCLPFDPRTSENRAGRRGDRLESTFTTYETSIPVNNPQASAELALTPQETWEMCRRIVKVDYGIPNYVPEEAREIIEALLVRDPKQRPSAAALMSWPCFERHRLQGI